MTEDDLFATSALRVFEPPPGGLDRVRATLDHRRPRWWLIALPAVATAIIIAIVVGGRLLGPSGADPVALAPLAPLTPVAPIAPLVADPTIASGDRVAFYWVASHPQLVTPPVRGPAVEHVDAVGEPPAVLIP